MVEPTTSEHFELWTNEVSGGLATRSWSLIAREYAGPVRLYVSETLPRRAHGPLPETMHEMVSLREAVDYVGEARAVRAGLSGKRWHSYVVGVAPPPPPAVMARAGAVGVDGDGRPVDG